MRETSIPWWAMHRESNGSSLDRSSVLLVLLIWVNGFLAQTAEPGRAQINSSAGVIACPKIWDDKELATWATPVAGLGRRPGFFSEADYYAAPIDNLRTYPVYHPRFEPKGYREWLKSQGPQPLIELGKQRTKADWVAAGRRVFEELDTAITRTDQPAVVNHFSDAAAIDKYRDGTHDVVTRDGIILEYRWVVDHDGKLKISLSSCFTCHSRLMPDGTLLRGAPSNYDLANSPAETPLLAKLKPTPRLSAGEELYEFHGVPWLSNDPHVKFKTMNNQELEAFQKLDSGAPVGTTFARFNGSPLFITRMADLIGVKDRRYLDATGTHLNRGPEDIARYGILVEYADNGVFGPHRFTTEMNTRLKLRPPDEAMYALGLYLYSLEYPKSPHLFDEQAREGQRIFQAENCAVCHTPPLYTNNKLVPVPEFVPSENASALGLRVSDRRVGTDSGLALNTRKGTGYYKIPTLRGLWYRGLYEHSGSVGSLEDWFDPKRLRADYVPTGWKGPGVKARAIPGHKFGLELSLEEKKALIAFLKTL
jgi:hypothetical protein